MQTNESTTLAIMMFLLMQNIIAMQIIQPPNETRIHSSVRLPRINTQVFDINGIDIPGISAVLPTRLFDMMNVSTISCLATFRIPLNHVLFQKRFLGHEYQIKGLYLDSQSILLELKLVVFFDSNYVEIICDSNEYQLFQHLENSHLIDEIQRFRVQLIRKYVYDSEFDYNPKRKTHAPLLRTKQGFMYKHIGKWKYLLLWGQWQMQYFVLLHNDGMLNCFKRQQDREPYKIIDIKTGIDLQAKLFGNRS
eukprot:301553_1